MSAIESNSLEIAFVLLTQFGDDPQRKSTREKFSIFSGFEYLLFLEV